MIMILYRTDDDDQRPGARDDLQGRSLMKLVSIGATGGHWLLVKSF